jgi:hypothetical protein
MVIQSLPRWFVRVSYRLSGVTMAKFPLTNNLAYWMPPKLAIASERGKQLVNTQTIEATSRTAPATGKLFSSITVTSV